MYLLHVSETSFATEVHYSFSLSIALYYISTLMVAVYLERHSMLLAMVVVNSDLEL
jgi:hypothetical protein